MCIRDSSEAVIDNGKFGKHTVRFEAGVLAQQADGAAAVYLCLLYTSDAADERSRVDLGGCRIIKKKKKITIETGTHTKHNHYVTCTQA